MTDKKQELVPVGSASGLKELLESRSEAIKTLASKYVTPDRLIKTALVAASRTPALYKCTKVSILQACMDAASLGVDLSPAKKHAAIVPFGQDATLIPMYQGYIAIAWRSSQIRINAAVVYQAELDARCFAYTLGTNPIINHAPLDAVADEKGEPIELGAPVYFYAVAFYPDGFKQFVVLSKREVDRVRNAAKAKAGPAWTNWYEEMGKKTAIRRLFKTLSMSDDMADLVDVDDSNTGLDESLLINAEVTPEASEDRAADLAGKLTKGKVLDFPGNGNQDPRDPPHEDEPTEPAPEPTPEPQAAPEPPEPPPAAKKRGRPAGSKNKTKVPPPETTTQPAELTLDPEPPEPTPEWGADQLVESLLEVRTEEDLVVWREAHLDHIGELETADKDRVKNVYIERQQEILA